MRKGKVRGSKSGTKKRAAAARKVDNRKAKATAKRSGQPASRKKSASKPRPRTVVRRREKVRVRLKSESAKASSPRRTDEIAEIRERLKKLIQGAAQKVADATEFEGKPDTDDLGRREE